MNLINHIRNNYKHDQIILIAVLVSCVLHAMIIVIVNYFFTNSNTVIPSRTEEHRFTLNSYHPPKTTTPDQSLPSLITKPVRHTEHRKKNTVTPSRKSIIAEKSIKIPAQQLDLSFENSDYSREAPNRQPFQRGGTTPNGATIMNGELLEIIKNSETSTTNIERMDLGPSTYGNSGLNGMSTYTKINGKCFLVSEPNPLDSLSSETWNRVKCR